MGRMGFCFESPDMTKAFSGGQRKYPLLILFLHNLKSCLLFFVVFLGGKKGEKRGSEV